MNHRPSRARTSLAPVAPYVLLVAAAACGSPPAGGATSMDARAPTRDVAPPTTPLLPTPVREHPVAIGRKVIIRAARLLDVRTGKIQTDRAIAILDDKIVKVAPSAEIAAAPGTEVVELKTGTVMPGFIDMHVHLTFDPKLAGWEHLGISLPREALTGAKNARLTLMAGFTTVRNLGAGGYSDVALRDAINAGDLEGPRIVAAGLALGITGGHCDETMLPFDVRSQLPTGVADGVGDVQKKVREQIKYGADVIKVCATGGVLSVGDDPKTSQYSLEELRAIVADAHRLGRRVAAHAHGGEGIRFAVDAGVDSIEHGTYVDDAAIAAMKAHGTWFVPTLLALSDSFFENAEKNHVPPELVAKAHEVVGQGLTSHQRAFKAGVRFAFGTDAGVFNHGENAREFALLVKMGMTPLQAIQSATTGASEALGWADKVGALEPGKWADIVAVDGDPLTDVSVLERVRFVMKSGEVYLDEGTRELPASRPRVRPTAGNAPPLHLDDEPKPPTDPKKAPAPVDPKNNPNPSERM